MYIKNETGNSVKIEIEYENRYDIKFDSIRYTNRQIFDISDNTRDSLDHKMSVDFYRNKKYRFEIGNNQIVLLEPLTIGVPIKKVIYEKQNRIDTIFNLNNRKLNHDLKSKGIIVKKGLSTRIIYLKQPDTE